MTATADHVQHNNNNMPSMNSSRIGVFHEWRLKLVGVLWVLVIVYPFLQVYHLSMTVPNDDVLDTPIRTSLKRETLHVHNHPSYNTSSVSTRTSTKTTTTRSIHPKTFPIPTKSTTTTTTTTTTNHNNNMTYEIFFAPSNVQKYGSPVIPVEERDWLEAKRKQWPPQHIPTPLPLPIFVLNMPKSGTQSIFDYFASCHHHHRAPGKHWTAHYWVRRFHSKIGQCLADNVWNDRPIAQGCGEAKLAGYAIYTDSGLMWNDDDDNDNNDEEEEEEQISNTISNSNNKTNNNNKEKKRSLMTRRKCFFPGVHGLENIAKYYPTATILHFPRTATEWVESSSHWNHLLTRYDTFCGGFPEVLSSRSSSSDSSHHPTMMEGGGDYTPKYPATTESEWVTWYEAYTQRIRDFARQHPTLTYVESPLEDINGTAALLQRLTGIPSSCYGRSHVNKKRRNKNKPENK
ncbi:hypothetical protein IV203_033969 [Nitzschia inconspicua]|uniref:Uncharacterized protein n=1 Tax=Nitzschia inconspicua TaxID=303405 RepID=A0A9K3M4Q8_9STRA|nr:hypothetical protein IV203_033969 [Nitzschia inconspicua]